MATKTVNGALSGVKITVTPKNEAERVKLEKYLTKNEMVFTVRGADGNVVKKTAGEIAAEEEYIKITNNDRFRVFNDELALIKAGTKTREQVIRDRIKAVKKGEIELVVR